ncbi:lamin tail domain-containing protein [Candidatus Kaiserbacteria bacterium]|nr:lamin tail domain-containing protein [Candidatus Kaiserbacteria bacterium]
MIRISLRSTLAISLVVFLFPFIAHAFPFGGRASIVLQCVYNSTIYANLGPPRGGEFIWTTGTKTYQFGPPARAGQWLLGLAGAPYYCIYRISPLTIYTGIAITMMGSSGSAAPAAPQTTGPGGESGRGPTGAPAPAPVPPPTPTPAPGGTVLLSEVYYAVDVAHGEKPANEWIEIYNGTQAAVNLGGWRIEDAFASDPIPAGTILSPGKFLVVAATSSTRSLWNIESGAFVSVASSLGDGLANGGDRIILKNASGAIVDALSWGTNTSIFKPSVPVAPYGYSTWRKSLTTDTNTASDWASQSKPSPGAQ